MKTIRLGIGLTTGRRSFKKVLKAYMDTWNDSKEDIPEGVTFSLSLFVSYDTDYQNTQSTDFTNLRQDIVDDFDNIVFIGAKNSARDIDILGKRENLTSAELKSVFGAGYAGKRNAILYSAIQYQMDFLLFLDDDEYPMAVTNSKNCCLWSGQRVFFEHLSHIEEADYTNGYHCGYVSPIPQIDFDNVLTEKDFRCFIGAISNDIINWDNIRRLMKTGGVTYASTDLLASPKVMEVPWENNCRFISGANLCINLQKPDRTLPFFNPPGARGEDTFLSTMLEDRKVYKVPCYAFHDGFSYYNHLLEGALPIHLKPITANSPKVMTRFVNACIGWVRYKPLFTYITEPDEYEKKIKDIRGALQQTVPLMSEHFHDSRFTAVPMEFEKYAKNVDRHYNRYIMAQQTWDKIIQL